MRTRDSTRARVEGRPIADRLDVLVIGGGPAGLAAAIELRDSAGLDVVVAEACGEPTERFGESLPPDILVGLDRLGLCDTFRAEGHLACPGTISAWGREKPGHNDFILNPMGPAWHIDRARFESTLRARAAAAGALICTRTRAIAAIRADDGFDVLLQHPSAGLQRMRAAWVLDATGPRAWFARQQGATRRKHDLMIAIVRVADIRSGTFTSQTIVESTPDGWWYCARLPGARIVTVLVTERIGARALTVAGHVRWRQLLDSTTLVGPRLAACRLDNEHFRSFPVLSSVLDRPEGDRWLAVGDAASAWDPIVAQGIYKALVDAADATMTIAAAVGRREPPHWRYADRVAARFEDYLADRARLYGLEQRWSSAPFWRHRANVSKGPIARSSTDVVLSPQRRHQTSRLLADDDLNSRLTGGNYEGMSKQRAKA
jgi:flavin-dependent dehydrogenase